ncbi:MAG TPA: ABC transporter permease, partial [bacterium]|nr:ABC transporter permease [bacterium]
MGLFALRRLVLLAPQTLGVVTLIFLVFRWVPGDPALIIAGPGATQTEIDAVHHDLGLDRPLLTQYGRFLGDLLRGDLGTSLSLRQPVTDVLRSRLPPTLALMSASLAVTVALAIPAGVVATARPHGLLAQGVMATSAFALAVPNFLLGMILIKALGVKLRLLPPAGTGGVL